ncbi:MAG: aldo/keto reductase [Chloroflexota bacterium]
MKKFAERRDLVEQPIGLGLAALGRPGYINLGHGDDLAAGYDVAQMEAQAHRMLDAAWAAGVRYFDAARSYGRAEAFLGSWLMARSIDPATVLIGSKWGYTYTADWAVNLPAGQKHEVKEHSLPVLQRQIAESRALLEDYLALYQIHSATLDSGVLSNTAVLRELANLRNSGLAIGLSVSGTQQSETIWQALAVQFDGEPLFASVQATWNVLEQTATAALEAAHEVGLWVIVKEGVANGRLTPRNPDLAQKAQLQKLAAENNTTIDALALAAVVNQPFVDMVLSGAAQRDHLVSNLGALDVVWNGRLADTVAMLAEPTVQYWQTRSQLAWN